jgi:hypothetical protein
MEIRRKIRGCEGLVEKGGKNRWNTGDALKLLYTMP